MSSDLLECCICFASECETFIDLDDTNTILADTDIIINPCRQHYTCINCMRHILNNYDNHPVNQDNSLVYCMYPLEQCVNNNGFRYYFTNENIYKIFSNNIDLERFKQHISNFEMPGFMVINCPFEYCNFPILLESNYIDNSEVGESIIQCDQNLLCMKYFCYSCKEIKTFFDSSCYNCKTKAEQDNPHVRNYFFNKQHATLDESIYTYKESEYLYLNKNITCEIAVNQILQVVNNVSEYLICVICKAGLYKTEKCNGLSHHNIERCYACGRIGYPVRGLFNHWNTRGHHGCYRFDYDEYIRNTIPEYACDDYICSNHDLGDCKIQEHQRGIELLQEMRKCSYIYHMLMSLMPCIRLQVYDEVFQKINCDLLPYKQTLMLLDVYKTHSNHFSEEIFYEMTCLQHPKNIFEHKQQCISNDDYNRLYKLDTQNTHFHNTTLCDLEISAWRQFLNTPSIIEEMRPLLPNVIADENNSENEHDSENIEIVYRMVNGNIYIPDFDSESETE